MMDPEEGNVFLCLLCNAKGQVTISGFGQFIEVAKHGLTWVECKCGSAFVQEVPDVEGESSEDLPSRA